MQVICILIRDQEVIFDFVEACFRFGARLAWSQEAVFLEFPTARNSLSLERLFEELEDLAEHFDVQTRISVAEDAPTALCFAHYGVSSRDLLPVEALRHYASPFRVQEDVETMIHAFRRLGKNTLRELRSVLPHAIKAEFGPIATQAFMRWNDKTGQAWPGFQFLENFATLPESYSVFHTAS